MARGGGRGAAKGGKCAGASKHRAAQAKYVGKNKTAQRARVKAHTKANKKEIATQRKASANKKSGGIGSHGHKLGRPREC